MADPEEVVEPSRRRDLDRVEDRLEQLALVTTALAELAMERLGITDEELARRLAEIDGRDGAVDGRRTPRPRPCTSCSAMVAVGRSTCQFCGAAQPATGPLDRL